MREIDLSDVLLHPSVFRKWQEIVRDMTPQIVEMGVKIDDIPDERALVDDENGILIIYIMVTLPKNSWEFSMNVPKGKWCYVN